jgi:hypothetical protein
MENKIIETAQLIADLYKTDGGGTGGYGHIVFDDENLGKEDILWCIEEAEKDEASHNEETRLASLKALNACLKLTEDELESVISYFWDKFHIY